MKIIKNIFIWLLLIPCGIISFFGFLGLFETFNLMNCACSLAFTLWTILLIGLISNPSSFLYKFAHWRKWTGWLGLALIFLGGLIPDHQHTWFIVQTTPASCSSVEINLYECSKCNIQEECKGELFLEHNWIKTEEILSNCVNTGKNIYTCSLCKNTKEEIVKVDKTLHNYILETETQPTFLERGHRIFKCSNCEDVKGEFFGLIKAPVSFKIRNYEKDFLGGITLNVSVTNNTDVQIKYVEYRIHFLNDVGDIIYSDLDPFKSTPMCWTITGPINSGKTKTFRGCGFYNQNFNGNYIIDKIVIEYMNSEVQYISNENFELYTNNLIK